MFGPCEGDNHFVAGPCHIKCRADVYLVTVDHRAP
jgi:hypothetical protein